MNKKAGIIVTGIIGVIFLAAAVVVFLIWRSDVNFYEAQMAEYERGIDELRQSANGKAGELSDARQQILQLQADLDAYKKALDTVNAERTAMNEENAAKKKAKEDEWNALSDAQRDAITRGAEHANVINYLLYHNEEYAELYAYMRDLSDRGLVELSNSEYKKYKEAKTRMNELEAETKAMLENEKEN